MQNKPPPYRQPPPVKKRGLSTVAIVFIVIGIITAGLVIGGTLMVMSTIKDFKNMFEPTSRVTAYVPTEADRQALKKKIAELDKIKKMGGEYTFTITPSDLNTYISENETDKAKDMEPRIRFNIQGNILSGMISIPITDDSDTIRYFNGEARFTAELVAGKLDVRLKAVLIRGKKPSFFISFIVDQFKKQNLVQELYNNPKHSVIVKHLQYCKKLSIKDGQAVVTLKFPKPTPETKVIQQINATVPNLKKQN